jgi:hypothetical protein
MALLVVINSYVLDVLSAIQFYDTIIMLSAA